MTNDALKPCPFCGKHAAPNFDDVACGCINDDCPIGGQIFTYEAWNTRAALAPMDVEGLRTMVYKFERDYEAIHGRLPTGWAILNHLSAQGLVGGTIDTSWMDADFQNEICGIVTKYGVQDIYDATTEILFAIQEKAAPKKEGNDA